MPGRPRNPIGTFGGITTHQIGTRRYRASTRLRDWDGQTRQVSATGESASGARAALKERIAERMRATGTGDTLCADSPFTDLADAWLDDLRVDEDRSSGTKEVYEVDRTTFERSAGSSAGAYAAFAGRRVLRR